MSMRSIALAMSTAVFLTGPSLAQNATPLTTIRVAAGLIYPVGATHAPGDFDRLFILEQRGRIRIVKKGQLLPTPFLDITTLVSLGGEQGLLGLAFHPDFANNRVFFIDYTNTAGDIVVAKFTGSDSNPDLADPSGDTILFIDHPPFPNHNGGWLEFGPDGYLYVAVGDGGSEQDPNGYGQSVTGELLANILRIDVNRDDFPADGLRDYGIPPDNPFVGRAGEDEIWAYGLRNPWRNTFDRQTGDLWIADVGQGEREEINVQPASSAGGENYGWSCREGTQCTTFGGCDCATFPSVLPIHDYPHEANRCSLTGGVVYRGCEIPDLQGSYFFADFCSGDIWSLTRDAGTVHVVNRTTELTPPFPYTINFVSSFGTDATGEIYICDRASTTGEVYKIVPASGVPVFLSSDPPEGAIDARTTLAPDGITPMGITQVTFFFDRPTNCAAPGDFIVQQQGAAGTPPQILSVQSVPNNGLLLTLDRPIPPKAWTTIVHGPTQSRVRIGYLPGDVGANRVSSPSDILDLVDFLNGVGPAFPIWSTDLDRSGATNPADILMLIDLLNGAGNLDEYLGATLP